MELETVALTCRGEILDDLNILSDSGSGSRVLFKFRKKLPLRVKGFMPLLYLGAVGGSSDMDGAGSSTGRILR